MIAEVQINNSTSAKARYVSWAPSPCRVRLSNPTGAIGPLVNVTLKSVSAGKGGAIQFRKTANGKATATLALRLPIDGGSVPFFVAGKFGRSSTNDGDVRIEVRAGTTLIGRTTLMVRVRKNANTLTAGERERFVAAFAQFNNQGAGRFVDFRNMHTNASSPQAHGFPGFLPWHRAYLLDLERELQAIDASVALPYWRFDQPAPNLFTLDFGVANSLGAVQFSAANPLQFWSLTASRSTAVRSSTPRPVRPT
jgi:tyrosinase